jgi:hypothetical protein
MDRTDAGKKAERLERAGKVGGGTAEDTGAARQAVPASGEKTGEGAPGLRMEEVLRRENVLTQMGLVSLLDQHRRLKCNS